MRVRHGGTRSCLLSERHPFSTFCRDMPLRSFRDRDGDRERERDRASEREGGGRGLGAVYIYIYI